MSKKIALEIICSNCKKTYTDNFFRTYWGESESMRTALMNDTINIATCPHCGYQFHVPLAMMYVDVQTGFAIWWEPQYDPGIDSDTKVYSQIFGSNSFYATAPRIADWEEFKRTINKYYSGELIGKPIEKMDFSALRRSVSNTKKRGCLGVITLFVIGGTILFTLLL